MIIDAELEFSDGQDLTSGDALSTNVVDLVATGYNACPNLKVVFRVGTAFTTLTSMTFEVWTDDTTTVTSGEMVISKDVVVADLTADTVVAVLDLPQGALQQYVGINYNTVGTNAGTGTCDAFLVNDVDNVFGKRLP